MSPTLQLLEETAKHINDYALIGLRTLAVAKRDLTKEEYHRFVADHQAASQAMSDREGKKEHWKMGHLLSLSGNKLDGSTGVPNCYCK